MRNRKLGYVMFALAAVGAGCTVNGKPMFGFGSLAGAGGGGGGSGGSGGRGGRGGSGGPAVAHAGPAPASYAAISYVVLRSVTYCSIEFHRNIR